MSSGSGGTFGNSANDSYVYVGGLPSSYWARMSALTAPSAMFLQRFNGYVRNVLYGNCSCTRRRAGLPLDGDGYTTLTTTDDACESPGVRHNCTRRCLCVGTDHGPACDCSDTGCNGGRSVYATTSVGLHTAVAMKIEDRNMHGWPIFMTWIVLSTRKQRTFWHNTAVWRPSVVRRTPFLYSASA